MVRGWLGRAGLLTLALWGGAGCGAPCGDACRKLINSCGYLDPWENVDTCATECEGLRENFTDPDERNAFDEHVTCLANSSCQALEEDPDRCGAPELLP